MPIQNRQRAKEKKWRKLVLERDGFKCQKCFSEKGLCAHHIKYWDNYPDIRYDLNNGLTLCRKCHAALHKNKKGKKSKKPVWNKGLKGLSTGWPKGKKFTKEHLEKLSKVRKGRKAWNKGIPMTEQTKKLQSSLKKGKKWIIDSDTGKRKWID